MSDFFDDEADESSDEEFTGSKKKPAIVSDEENSSSEDSAEDEEGMRVCCRVKLCSIVDAWKHNSDILIAQDRNILLLSSFFCNVEVDKQLAAEADDQGNIQGLIDDDVVEEGKNSFDSLFYLA